MTRGRGAGEHKSVQVLIGALALGGASGHWLAAVRGVAAETAAGCLVHSAR